ncbi:MAG: ThiF family adenylyltransferase [Burkholderiales bacterium]|nr:ThiF family adenylyltransferase [Burkholderiales bacterium]
MLKIDAGVLARLRAFHLAPGKQREALSYLWATAVPTAAGLTVLVPHNAPVFLMGDDCYERQSGGNVRLAPEVLNGLLVQFAATDWNCLVNCHDHWFDERTEFSSIDDRDDLNFDRYLRQRFEPMLASNPHIGPNRRIHNASLVLARDGLDARVVDGGRRNPFRRFDHVHELGTEWRCVAIGRESPTISRDPRFARHTDFVPLPAQAALASMRVLLAGCGGLGSILAEALARVGVGAIDLVDDDRVSLSNLNRWQGGRPVDVGASKSRRLAARLRRMFPELRVRSFDQSLFARETEPLFGQASVLVAGLDNDEARYFLNRTAAQYMLPYFDAGVAVDTSDSGCDFCTRFFAVLPGQTPCLECTQLALFDRGRTLEAFLDEATAQARRNAGYVTDHAEIDAPSVYPLNLRASGLLITEMLNYMCHWRATAVAITESWRSGKFMRYDRDNFPEMIHPDCAVCHHYAGVGPNEPLPRPRWFAPRRLAIRDGCWQEG